MRIVLVFHYRIVRKNLLILLLLLNAFPNLHPFCAFHISDLLLLQTRGLLGPGQGRHMRGNFYILPGRHMRNDFSNRLDRAGTWRVLFPTGRTGKKRNELFNYRVWLQKKGRRIILWVSPSRHNKDSILKLVDKSLIMNLT